MASRVNTKFVVILIAGVVLMLGAVFAAYTVVFKSADDLAKRGDMQMSQQNYEQAAKLYSKAVNKDTQAVEYVEKWIGALESWTPPTETAFVDAYRKDYLGAMNHAATVLRTDVEAYDRMLGLRYEMLKRQYAREAADVLITQTTDILGYFDGTPGVDPKWETLRRYRGLAWERIAFRDGLVDADVFDLVREDLEAAIAAEPTDDESNAALMRWIGYVASQQISGSDFGPLQEARRASVALGEAFVERNPNSPLTLVTIVSDKMNIARVDAAQGRVDGERSDAIRASLAESKDLVLELGDDLMGMPEGELPIEAVQTFQILERLSIPERRLEITSALVDKLLEENPQDARVMQFAASNANTAGEQDRALELYAQIVDLPSLPIGLDGVELFGHKRVAHISAASILMDMAQREEFEAEPDQGVIDELVERARAARDSYAEGVSEDDTALLLIDGRLAQADGNIHEALRLFKQFNQQTQNGNATGLWQEAIASRALDQLGTARLALLDLLELGGNNIRALLMLADVEIRLQEYDAAKSRYQRVLTLDSQNSLALQGLENVDSLLNPSLVDDPALALILEARQARRGSSDQPGNVSRAIEIFAEGIEGVDYAPDVTREFVSLLLDSGDINGARNVITRALQSHPQDDALNMMNDAVALEDPTDILIAMVTANESDPVERDIAIATIAFSRGKPELLEEKLATLIETAPQNPSVVDLAFVHALRSGDTQLAQEMADKGTQYNTDRVNGLSYKARIASYQGNHDEAVQLLEQARSTGTADSSILRMLALEQRIMGQYEESIEAFEESLAIRPDDQQSIVEYISTLIASGRTQQALDVARRFQRYSMDNQQFLSMWLSLESALGGVQGRDFAIGQREKFLELNPGDKTNRELLASMYIEAQRWDEAGELIRALREENDQLRYAVLEARWYADQGRVGNRSGLGAARQVLNTYIQNAGADEGADPYIALARFMLERGRPDLAVQAATEAVSLESEDTLEGSKLMGDLLLSLNQYSNAAEAFKRIVDAGADQDDVYRLKLVDTLIRTQQFEEARTALEGLTEENKGSLVGLLQLAEIEEGVGDDITARQVLDRAVSRYPDDAIAYIKRAEFLAGDELTLTDMLADIDAALQINQDDWRAYRVRAAGYFAVDRRDNALRDLMRAVRLNPRLDQALFGIVNELMIDGREGEAFDFSLEILERRPRDASLANSLGQLFASRESWDKAVHMYTLVWDMQRSPSAGSTLIDAIARMRNPDTNLANAVIRDLGELAGDVEDSPGLLAAQALVLKARGREELALQQLTKAFDISVNSDEQLVQWSGNLARLFEGEGVENQIRYVQSLKRRNTNPEILNWLDLFIAQRLVLAGSQTDTAAELFERLASVQGQDLLRQTALRSWGTMLYGQDLPSEAVAVWKRGIDAFPDDWEMNNNLAYVLSVELGEHEDALGYAERAIERSPERSEPYDTLASIYTSLERYDEALQMINTGMRYGLSVRSRVLLQLAQIRVHLGKGEVDRAKSVMLDIKALMRAMPTRIPSLEESVQEMQTRIDSAG